MQEAQRGAEHAYGAIDSAQTREVDRSSGSDEIVATGQCAEHVAER